MRASRLALLRAMGPWLGLALFVILADQASKAQVIGLLQMPGRAIAVSDFFNLVLAYNRGAAFSFLNDAGGWQDGLFLAIGLGASGFLVALLAGHRNQPLFATALSLILGGAMGNVIDRLRLGHVVDFLDFHWRWLEVLFPAGHFPAFNLADSAICCGASLLILEEVRRLGQRSARVDGSRNNGTGQP